MSIHGDVVQAGYESSLHSWYIASYYLKYGILVIHTPIIRKVTMGI